jgi:hypothetical protein
MADLDQKSLHLRVLPIRLAEGRRTGERLRLKWVEREREREREKERKEYQRRCGLRLKYSIARMTRQHPSPLHIQLLRLDIRRDSQLQLGRSFVIQGMSCSHVDRRTFAIYLNAATLETYKCSKSASSPAIHIHTTTRTFFSMERFITLRRPDHSLEASKISRNLIRRLKHPPTQILPTLTFTH